MRFSDITNALKTVIKNPNAVDDYKAQRKAEFDTERKEDQRKLAKGVSADIMSHVTKIADKHGVSRDQIKSQLKLGQAVELEHTQDKMVATKIALDHLRELPDYYTKLQQVEKPN